MSRHPLANPQTAVIRRQLLRWYDLHHRPLPWRESRDPYRVWISEIMLQQTRVEAMIPYYEKFLRCFPDVQALAAANEEALLACWSGLGYYSRARNLQRAAQVVVKECGGAFPGDFEAALVLPGVGAYTAAAVLSIAYDVPLAVLDGNVARVISRLFAIPAVIRKSAGKQTLQKRASDLLAPRRPGDFNQALMELGATVCTPQQPRCEVCPVRKNCQSFAKDAVGMFPPPDRKMKVVLRRFSAALILDDNGRCLLARRGPTAQWMAGFWELPMREDSNRDSHGSIVADSTDDGILMGPLLGYVRHTITNNKLEVIVFRAKLRRAIIPRVERWVSLRNIERLPVTTITRKALRLLFSRRTKSGSREFAALRSG